MSSYSSTHIDFSFVALCSTHSYLSQSVMHCLLRGVWGRCSSFRLLNLLHRLISYKEMSKLEVNVPISVDYSHCPCPPELRYVRADFLHCSVCMASAKKEIAKRLLLPSTSLY